MAVWTLIPDKLDEDEQPRGRWGAFATTLVVFFVAEIGDKTQLATTALAARYDSVLLATAGSTLGMLIANAPVILLGPRIISRLQLRLEIGRASCRDRVCKYVRISGVAVVSQKH